MNKDKFWTNIFVNGITVIIFAIYITAVFFAVEGNWSFLTSLNYWGDIASGSALAFVLRYLWSLKGVEIALEGNEKISKKEESKSALIAKIDDGHLISKLEEKIDTTNLSNKKKAYRNKCDRKIKLYQHKLIPFHSKLRDKWSKEKVNTEQEDFNWDNVKVKYYQYKKDNLLSSYYKGEDNTSGDTSDTTLLGMTVLSMRTNILTIIALIFFNALNVLRKDFAWSEVYILLGKMVIFAMNMNNGFGLGKKYIKVLYNRQLTKDYTFLKTFLDNEKATN